MLHITHLRYSPLQLFPADAQISADRNRRQNIGNVMTAQQPRLKRNFPSIRRTDIEAGTLRTENDVDCPVIDILAINAYPGQPAGAAQVIVADEFVIAVDVYKRQL